MRGGGNIAKPTNRLYYADQLDTPVNSNWVGKAFAPETRDSVNNALICRNFDDTTEEGVGFIETIPATSTSVKLSIKSRAQTAPGAARTVGLKPYYRQIPDDSGVPP